MYKHLSIEELRQELDNAVKLGDKDKEDSLMLEFQERGLIKVVDNGIKYMNKFLKGEVDYLGTE